MKLPHPNTSLNLTKNMHLISFSMNETFSELAIENVFENLLHENFHVSKIPYKTKIFNQHKISKHNYF